MEIKTSKLVTLISASTVLMIALGMIIQSIYLSDYQIFQTYYFKPRVVFIGFVFSLILLTHLVFYLAIIDLSDLLSTPYWLFAVRMVIKFILASNLFFAILFSQVFSYLDSTLFLTTLFRTGFYPTIIITLIYIVAQDSLDNKKDILYYFYNGVIIFLSVYSVLVFYAYLEYFEQFKEVLSFEYYLATYVFLIITFRYAIIRDVSKGIEIKKYSLFAKDKPVFGFSKALEKIFFSVYLILAVFIIIRIYTINIYPKINTSYGGGSPIEMTFTYFDDTISGKVVYYTSDRIYLLDDSTIIKYEDEMIDKILLNK